MGKLLDVDFKNKRLHLSWDDNHRNREEMLLSIAKLLDNAMGIIKDYNNEEMEYNRHIAKDLTRILRSLKERL